MRFISSAHNAQQLGAGLELDSTNVRGTGVLGHSIGVWEALNMLEVPLSCYECYGLAQCPLSGTACDCDCT